MRTSVRTLTCRATGSAREGTEPLAKAGAYKKQGAARGLAEAARGGRGCSKI